MTATKDTREDINGSGNKYLKYKTEDDDDNRRKKWRQELTISEQRQGPITVELTSSEHRRGPLTEEQRQGPITVELTSSEHRRGPLTEEQDRDRYQNTVNTRTENDHLEKNRDRDR
jgi:hypothetical protein